VYLVALPALMFGQGIAMYLWRGSPDWWLHIAQSILG
jgi:hypothetical protein